MAKRNSGRRGRSRKRRPAATGAAAEGAQGTPPSPAKPRASAAAEPGAAGTGARASRRERELARARAAQERPQAPWHPLPLSELLILVGAVGVIVGLKRLQHGGISGAGGVLVAGVAAVAIGTIEVTLREHLSGYRAHTLLLALIPAIALHTLVIFGLSAFVAVPRWVNIPVLVLDVALFAFLYKVLRERFLDARRRRLYAAGG